MTAIASAKASIDQPGKTYRLTAAQALVRYLAAQKSEQLDGSIQALFGGIWAIFGHGNVAGLGEALANSQEILPTLRGQNEQGMAHAAIAYGKAHFRRRVMGVTTSIGPGATNLVTAAGVAHANRLPLFLLPGDVFAGRAPDPVLQQIENPQSPLCTANRALEPLSRFYDQITRPEQLLASLPQAMRVLMDPVECGPVTLALCQDVQCEAYDFPIEFFEEKVHFIRRQAADERELLWAAKTLLSAKKPLILAGGGALYSGAGKALQAFSEKHGIPIGESQAGKGVVPWNSSLHAGGIGVTGTDAANRLAFEADVVLCVGTRLQDFSTASKSLFCNPNVKFVGLNVASMDGHKLGAQTVIGDAKRSIEALGNSLGEWQTKATFQKHCREVISSWQTWRADITSPKEGLMTDAQVLRVVNDLATENSVVVCAAGGLPGEMHRHWNASAPGSYHLEYGYSCMGYEIAGALGVKLAHPEKEVYALVGDGSYLMLHTELLTARLLGAKIHVILCDNGGFGCINRLQQSCGQERFKNLLPSAGLVDFVANAQSYGLFAEGADSTEDLAKSIEKCRSIEGPCLTRVFTDPERGTPGLAGWDVAVAEVSPQQGVQKAFEEYRQFVGRRGVHHGHAYWGESPLLGEQ